MTPDQTKMILAKAALLDNRTVDLTVIKAWHEVIGHFEYEDVLAALNLHRLESTEYLMPAHIKANMTRAKAMRKTAQARQRAIEVAKEREILGEHASPTAVARYRELKAELGESFTLPTSNTSAPATVLNLYDRLHNNTRETPSLDKTA